MLALKERTEELEAISLSGAVSRKAREVILLALAFRHFLRLGPLVGMVRAALHRCL
jgi:hypothetical protein